MKSDSRPLAEIAATRAQLHFASWTKDVLIYIVVLNLFVEYVEIIVIDSFTISIFTAILLKGILDLILRLEHRVADYFKQRPGMVSKVLRVLSTWLILLLSKFVILEGRRHCLRRPCRAGWLLWYLVPRPRDDGDQADCRADL